LLKEMKPGHAAIPPPSSETGQRKSPSQPACHDTEAKPAL
jgi:hypothetical protein